MQKLTEKLPEIAEDLWSALSAIIVKRQQSRIAREIVEVFEQHDCDLEGTELYDAACIDDLPEEDDSEDDESDEL